MCIAIVAKCVVTRNFGAQISVEVDVPSITLSKMIIYLFLKLVYLYFSWYIRYTKSTYHNFRSLFPFENYKKIYYYRVSLYCVFVFSRQYILVMSMLANLYFDPKACG